MNIYSSSWHLRDPEGPLCKLGCQPSLLSEQETGTLWSREVRTLQMSRVSTAEGAYLETPGSRWTLHNL